MPEQLDHCLLCDHDRLAPDEFASQFLNLAPPHRVVACSACTFRFLSPRPTAGEYREAYSRHAGPLAEMYPAAAEFYSTQDELRVQEFRNKLDRLAQLGIRTGRILEIGACTGKFLNEARQRGFDVVGIEPSDRDRAVAREEFGLEILPGNVEDQQFEPDSFDAVFSSHVFEHLLDPLAVARQLVTWLRPGGIHMLEIPNQLDLPQLHIRRWGLRRLRPKQRDFTSIHHTVFYSRKTLRQFAERSNCDVEHIRGVWYRAPAGRSAFRVFKRGVAMALGGVGALELAARKRRR